MKTQILLVVLFALNLLLLNRKFAWYRLPGTVILAILPVLSVFLPQPRFELDFFWWRIAGIAIMLLGILIAGWAILEFKKQNVNNLVTSGPYQFVRHPQYLGLIFVWAGWWWLWAAAYSFYFGMIILALTWLHAYFEEKQLGDQYREYRKNTGMFWIK